MTKKYVYFADFFLTKIGLYHIIKLRTEVEVENENYSSGNQVEGGKVALELLKEKLAQGAKTLGLATGSSPEGFYKQIVESDLDFFRDDQCQSG